MNKFLVKEFSFILPEFKIKLSKNPNKNSKAWARNTLETTLTA